MEPGERKKAVRALFVATGEAHHVAFAAADGDDPEWPAWYAAYLQPRLAEEAGITIAHNQLERLLVEADRAFENQTVEKDWAEFYADLLLALPELTSQNFSGDHALHGRFPYGALNELIAVMLSKAKDPYRVHRLMTISG